MALVVSLSIAISMINDSVEDWDRTPMTTNVERTDGTNVEDEIFPAITICRGPKTQPDNWALSELILNFFRFHCTAKLGKRCDNRRRKIQEDFHDLFDARFKDLILVVDGYFLKYATELRKNFKDYSTHDKLQAIIQSNVSYLEHFDSFLKENMFKSTSSKISDLIEETYKEVDQV